MRRSDISTVVITYANGDAEVFQREDIREGYTTSSVNLDKEGKGRQEWDTFDVHISGPKRSVRQAP